MDLLHSFSGRLSFKKGLKKYRLSFCFSVSRRQQRRNCTGLSGFEHRLPIPACPYLFSLHFTFSKTITDGKSSLAQTWSLLSLSFPKTKKQEVVLMIFEENYKKPHTNSLGKVHFALLLRRAVSCRRSHEKIVKIHQIAWLNTATCADTAFYFLDIPLRFEYSNQINTRTQKCSDHAAKTKFHLPTDLLFNSSPKQMLKGRE